MRCPPHVNADWHPDNSVFCRDCGAMLQPPGWPKTMPVKPKLQVDPETGAVWLALRDGPPGHVRRTVQINGPLADGQNAEVDDPAGKANGIWLVDYDAEGNVCGVEVV